MRQPRCHSGARGEKLVGVGGAIIATEGSTVGLCQLILTQTRLAVGSDRRQCVHFASCIVAMAWISASWQYILSTLSAVSGGKALRGLAAMALA
jgi:hypothetical protein